METSPCSAVLRAERGSVFAEYVVLLFTVSLGCAAAAASLGPALLRLYYVQEAVLMLPVPL
jgi:hypothetical protein